MLQVECALLIWIPNNCNSPKAVYTRCMSPALLFWFRNRKWAESFVFRLYMIVYLFLRLYTSYFSTSLWGGGDMRSPFLILDSKMGSIVCNSFVHDCWSRPDRECRATSTANLNAGAKDWLTKRTGTLLNFWWQTTDVIDRITKRLRCRPEVQSRIRQR